MKNRIVLKITVLVAVLLCGVFYGWLAGDVFADSEGGGHQTGVYCEIDNANVYACEYGRNGVGGAAWKWYSWPEGADKVEIPRYVNEDWPQVNLIGDDPYIRGCGDVGGYWRYAFVAVRDGNSNDSGHYLEYRDGSRQSFKKGDQLGLASIGDTELNYKAAAFGGDMYYNDVLSTRSFGEVEQIYRDAQAKNPGRFKLGWNGNSSLSWFCAGNPDLPASEEKTTEYEAKLDMTVKNDRTGKEGKEIYAKPTDSLTYHVEYNPAPQMVYDVKTPKVIINNGEKEINEPGDKTAGELFNSWGGMTWKNDFCVSGGLLGTKCGEYDKGDSGEKDEYYSVNINGVVGKAFSDTAKTLDKDDSISSGLVTPTKTSVTTVDGVVTKVGVSTNPISSGTTVVVPYNFENSVKIDIDEDKDVFYAGETVSLSFKLVVGDKYNKYTSKDADDKYATSVPGAEWGIQVKYDNEGYSDVVGIGGKGDLNVNESNEHSESANIPVRDVVAGTEICVRVWMTPGNSGSDGNLSPSGFSGDAQDEVCVKVAKRPSFQVWGGSAYSASMIDAPSARKTDIAVEGFDGKARTFGSWTELALVVKGKNEIMASGAGFGYDGGIGGSIDGSAYDTLTTSNEHSLVGGLASVLSDTAVGMPDKDSLEETLKDKGYYKVEGNVGDILSGPSLEDEPKRLYMVDSDIELNSDIDINRSRATYNNFAETPSIIIYTTGDIKIGCNVKTIDAVLIAGKTIDTCAGYDEDVLKTTQNGANLLRINGVLSASRIELNRTGGASVGAQSIEPAEVVNYDSSFMIPGTGSVDAGRDETTLGNFVVEAVSELAPRY